MLRLNPLFHDNAVLQCDKPFFVWGTQASRMPVSVTFDGQVVAARFIDRDRWSAEFPPVAVGGPYELRVTSGSEGIVSRNIFVGEVWLCSGQSNMEWTLRMLKGLESDIAEANDPLLRFFNVPRKPADNEISEADGVWQTTSPKSAQNLSATAYFFARDLRAKLGRPIGLVIAAYGGTSITCWMDEKVLLQRPDYSSFSTQTRALQSTARLLSLIPYPFESRSVLSINWETDKIDDTDWPELSVPATWQEQGWKHNGVVWYRRSFNLPPAWAGQELILEIGACDDFDETYFNGTKIGETGPNVPNAYATRRAYRVPLSLTKEGQAIIAVRVFDNWGNGGITDGVTLRPCNAPGLSLALNGKWRAKVETALPWRPCISILPSMLFNGMIHPVIGYALRGIAWYQGESDSAQAALYRLLLNDLIASWRARWNDQLPFGIVQLANSRAHETEPTESDWAELRDAQLLVARTLGNTGLAVTIDVGDATDIHPSLKQPVGERLSLWALGTVYGHSVSPWCGPLTVDHWSEGPEFLVRFSYVGTGLQSRYGNPLIGFQIAGQDRRWQWAEAKIVQPDIIRITAPGAVLPAAVRYAWPANPRCNRGNSAGLPRHPFRNDDWPLT